MKENQHAQAIPSTILTQAQEKVEEAKTMLASYMQALTPAERQSIAKMGEKSLAFVEKAYDFAQQNSNLVPPYLDMAAFGVDFADAHGLWNILNAVQQLENSINDTEMLAGSEAYQAALVFYHSAKAAADKGVDGAEAVYEELRKRFPQRGRRRTESEAS